MNEDKEKLCMFCKRNIDILHKHHVVPVVKGGKFNATVDCCKTCSQQIHMLFTEAELQKMTLEQLNEKSEWQSYLKWISSRNGEFSVKMSTRVKRKKRRR